MAILLGGTLGSFIGMLVVCYLVFKLGPNKRAINFTLQALISGLITLYLSTAHDGIHYRQIDVVADWAGWALALAVMFFVVAKKKTADIPPP